MRITAFFLVAIISLVTGGLFCGAVLGDVEELPVVSEEPQRDCGEISDLLDDEPSAVASGSSCYGGCADVSDFSFIVDFSRIIQFYKTGIRAPPVF